MPTVISYGGEQGTQPGYNQDGSTKDVVTSAITSGNDIPTEVNESTDAIFLQRPKL